MLSPVADLTVSSTDHNLNPVVLKLLSRCQFIGVTGVIMSRIAITHYSIYP